MYVIENARSFMYTSKPTDRIGLETRAIVADELWHEFITRSRARTTNAYPPEQQGVAIDPIKVSATPGPSNPKIRTPEPTSPNRLNDAREQEEQVGTKE
jgi:hypothetical protein